MASSYSTDLKLELMVTGENAGTWGDKTNTNLNLVQQAIAGYEAIALTDLGTVTLTMSNAALSNARNMVLKFTGTLTGASTVTIPDAIEKFYIFDLSAVIGVTNLTIKTVSGTGFTAGEAAIVAAYSDGTNLSEIALNTLGGTIGSAQIDANSITAAKISNNAVTTDKILQSNVTTAKLAASAVTGNNIAQSTITQAKLAEDSVGPNQLISTGVTAAEYTVATITVDADGRITAASSGVAGGSNMVPVLASASGGDTGTYTANPAASKIHVYLAGGGGGGGGRPAGSPNPSGAGGWGGFGLWTTPVAAPYSQPWSVGNGGGSPVNNPLTGQAGNPSTLGSFVANAGSGGPQNGSPAGSTGNAPGATVTYINPGSPDGYKNSTGALFGGYTRRHDGGGNNNTSPVNYQIGSRIYGVGQGGGPGGGNPAQNFFGGPGTPGIVKVYEDIG